MGQAKSDEACLSQTMSMPLVCFKCSLTVHELCETDKHRECVGRTDRERSPFAGSVSAPFAHHSPDDGLRCQATGPTPASPPSGACASHPASRNGCCMIMLPGTKVFDRRLTRTRRRRASARSMGEGAPLTAARATRPSEPHALHPSWPCSARATWR